MELVVRFLFWGSGRGNAGRFQGSASSPWSSLVLKADKSRRSREIAEGMNMTKSVRAAEVGCTLYVGNLLASAAHFVETC
jgi:hypothetical protein